MHFAPKGADYAAFVEGGGEDYVLIRGALLE